MHRFPSKSTIFRFKFVAFLLVSRCVIVPLAVGLLVFSFFEDDHDLTIVALGVGLFCVVMSLLQWSLAGRTRCPLCLTPVLAINGCSKHRHARTLFGSHRLRVAMGIVFRGTFHCPYCHEPSMMAVRSRQPRTQTTRY